MSLPWKNVPFTATRWFETRLEKAQSGPCVHSKAFDQEPLEQNQVPDMRSTLPGVTHAVPFQQSSEEQQLKDELVGVALILSSSSPSGSMSQRTPSIVVFNPATAWHCSLPLYEASIWSITTLEGLAQHPVERQTPSAEKFPVCTLESQNNPTSPARHPQWDDWLT
jgi:hypothetical protein